MPANSNKRLNVFLCHAAEDSSVAGRVNERLKKQPWIETWFSDEKLVGGQDRTRTIRQAIEKADTVILFVSGSLTKTEGDIQRQLRSVMDRRLDMPEGQIFIIPMRLDVSKNLPYDLDSWVSIDYSLKADRKKAHEKLVASLRSAAESRAIRISPPPVKKKPKKTKKSAGAKIALGKETTPGGHPVYAAGKMELVRIPAGPFRMGSSLLNLQAYPDERPQLDELIPYDYFIGRYPVTVEQYVRFVEWNEYEHEWVDDIVRNHDHPVTCITSQAAVDFCKWLTQQYKKDLPPDLVFRLPLEVEWEKAARGDQGFEWPWGNEFDSEKCNSRENGRLGTSAVGAYSASGGDSPYGAADMSGNVWEWTATSFKRYPYHSGDGRENEEGGQTCVVRGGSFNDGSKYTRATYRYMNPQPILYYFQGFRVVLGPPVSTVVAKCPPRPLPEG